MEEGRSSYRQIIKATSVFGGVQFFNILINIVRTKFIAVLLGPAGTGIVGLLNSSTGLISGLTNFGLGTSAVRNVSEANAFGDDQRIGTVLGVLKRLAWITGLLGAIVTIVLSPWLSQITFGNRDYTVAYLWISVTLLLNQISAGQTVLLQGTRQLNFLARASLLGSLAGLCISVPLYYFYGVDGIVPAIIITSLSSLLLSWYYSDKVKISRVKITRQIILEEGRGMVTMGFMLSLSGLIALGASYILRIFISNNGGIDQVGLYNAGFAIVNTYVGMIFTAMSIDYYPRLAGLASDNIKASELINQQSEIAILILSPILTLFIVFINYVVIVLFSTKFVPINGMIQWAALGMYFKTVSWAMAFILLAKGASRLYLWNELIATIYLLGLNIAGYKYAGLTGLGISFLAGYLLYTLQVYFLIRIKYGFTFRSGFLKVFVIQLLLGTACFLLIKYIPQPWSFTLAMIMILSSTILSVKELDKRLGLKALWVEFRNRSSN
jgi:O-antigen/teichoic acid export membrane protein